jgi:Family of unknown function (DUF6282)
MAMGKWDDEVAAVLDGMADLHCHSGPNPFPREFDHVQAARDAARLNMSAILVKSHHHNTVMDLLAMQDALAETPVRVFGGIVLNSPVGGINPEAVAMSLRMGGRAVWLPTFSSRAHAAAHPEGGGFPTPSVALLPPEMVQVRAEGGGLRKEMLQVLDLVAESDALLLGGHMYPDEIVEVFTAAAGRSVRRLVINHPNFIVNADIDTCRQLVGLGAFVEHEVGQYDPLGNKKWDPRQLLDWIGQIGAANTVLASDLGQKGRPLPVDSFMRVGRLLLESGLPEKDLRLMTVSNPAFLLGLVDDRVVG